MLKLKNVRKEYIDDRKEKVVALDDVNLTFPETGLVVITGTSGCGKTTLLNILGGLDKPTVGAVHICDERIDDKDEKWWDSYRGSNLGFVYQDFNLLENMTVRQNLELPLDLIEMDEREKKERIEKIVVGLGLDEYVDKRTGKLSGGQKQRVAIARAIVTGAKIILADEPTGNLDRENSENVFRVLKEIANNRLVIVVTHDGELATAYADRLINIRYGKIANDEEFETQKTSESDNATTKFISRKLPIREAWKFAKEAMKQRVTRCFVSVMIFSITLLFILLICEAVFRNDARSITQYIQDENQRILPLYIGIPDEYNNLTSDGEVDTGKILYDTICKSVDKSRIIKGFGGNYCIEFSEEVSEYLECAFVCDENEEAFSYEGTFPQKADEIAITNNWVEKLGEYDKILGSKVKIQGKEFVVTAIVNGIYGKNIKDIYFDDGSDDNVFDRNVVFFYDEFLLDEDMSTNIYMSGFGISYLNNLFYQTSLFDKVKSVEDEIELIAGSMPTKDSEVLISASELESIQREQEDVLGKTYSLYDIYDEEYGTAYWNLLNLYDYIGKNFTIVGVAEGDGDFYVTQSLYDSMFEDNAKYYEMGYCLLVDDDALYKDMSNLVKNDVKINDSKLKKVYEVIENVNMGRIVMLIVVFIISILTILQMVSLFSYSINDNKKTIGILRTLGVTKSDTKKIFTLECIVVSMISFAVAIAVGLVLTGILNDIISQKIFMFEGFSFLRMRVVVVVMVGLINCALSVLSVLVPLRKFSKIKIIELLK